MTIDQLKQIDINSNKEIEETEIEKELEKSNWFFSNKENLENLWLLLNEIDINEWDNELLIKSLEKSFIIICEKIIQKPEIDEKDKEILWIWKKILWQRHTEIVSILEEVINNQLIKEWDIRIYNEISEYIMNYSENLKELWIDINKIFKRKNIINDIKTLEDINKIDESNIKKYINIPDDILDEKYQYIVSNVKEILWKHLQLHPWRRAVFWFWWLSTWMSIESVQQSDEQLICLYEKINKLKNLDMDKQISQIVDGLPNNARLFELWLKSTLTSKNQEEILKEIYDKITLNDFEKLQDVSKNNVVINEIKNWCIIYQVQKNNWLKEYWEWDSKLVMLDLSKENQFKILYNKWCKDFDDLYNQTLECKPIITFYEQNENYKKKIKELEQQRDEELKKEKEWYNKQTKNWQFIVITETQNPQMDHVNREQVINNKYKKLIWEQCINIEIAYVKCLLAWKDKPTGKREWITWTWVMLDFSKWTDPNKIVRDSFWEKVWDQRDQFKYDLKNDRQAAFWSFVGMVWWIVWSAAVAIFTKNIWATSAWFSAWLRLGNWVWQELWNSWEWVYEKVSWNEIDSWNNKVTKFWTSFLRGVWAYDENYEYVWTAKFLSWLWFDYLSTVATFWLSKQFWWFLWKLEWIKFAWWALKFWMEELILENFFVDIPINIVQTWFETFTWIDNWVTIWNTAIWNQQTMEWQWYKSWSLSDALKAMKDATEQNISFENLSQTFFNTVIYWWLLEWWWAAIRKMKAYLPKWQVSDFEKSSAAAASAFLGLTNFMTTKKIEFNKDWKCIDSDTKKELVEWDSRLSELYNHLNAVSVTKTDVINSMETLFNTQKNMLADPESRTWLLFRLWLISDKNTPGNILKKKKELIEKKLNEAKAKWDNNKVNQLQKLLDIYTDAETKLNETTNPEWETHEIKEADPNQQTNNELSNKLNELKKLEKEARDRNDKNQAEQYHNQLIDLYVEKMKDIPVAPEEKSERKAFFENMTADEIEAYAHIHQKFIFEKYNEKYKQVANVDDFREFIGWDIWISADKTHGAASFLGDTYFDYILETNRWTWNNTIKFLAWWPWSGKSSVSAFPESNNNIFSWVLDWTMKTYKNAEKNIENALAMWYNVRVEFVYRDITESFINGVLKRTISQNQKNWDFTWRTVPLDVFEWGHNWARNTALKLYEKYGPNIVKFFWGGETDLQIWDWILKKAEWSSWKWPSFVYEYDIDYIRDKILNDKLDIEKCRLAVEEAFMRWKISSSQRDDLLKYKKN